MEKVESRLALSTDLDDAPISIHSIIDQQLAHIVFQPLVDLRTKRVFAQEALVRTHVVHFKNPLVMFRAATEVERVGELGRMLRQMAVNACTQQPLFLNIVPQEFDQGWLLQPDDPIFSHHKQVYIEITESVPLHYSDLCTQILERARERGVRLAVDDLGAGYSNLKYIADLEPDIVKLDRELIAGLNSDSRRFRLVKNVVRLCLDMGAEVVAEGIETGDELAAVIDAGVHYGQGFALALPAVSPPGMNWPLPSDAWVPPSVDEPAPPRDDRMHCIDNRRLLPFLDRRRRMGENSYEVDLAGVLSSVLEKANEFVPSAAGTIFLDDPVLKTIDSVENELVFVACFGKMADTLLGTRLPATKGIVGRVYHSGKAYVSSDPDSDQFFYRAIDEKTKYKTQSVLCVPLRVESQVIGAIQLLNRLGSKDFNEEDLEMLEIFAQSISSSIINAVDAQRAQNLAKRDDLTGLFNDRFFHFRLLEVVGESLAAGKDTGLIFLDLDNFKQINDTRGHLVGSRILREIGMIFRQILPKHAIPSRYGGDEFVVIFPETSLADLRKYAEDIRSAIADFTFLNSADPYDPKSFPALKIHGELSCSIGVATLNDDVLPLIGTETDDPLELKNKLVEISDKAMYCAKELGKNRVASRQELGPAFS